MPETIRQSTIGDFIRQRTRLSFHCADCGQLREIDLHKLGAALGMDWELYWPEPRKTAKPVPVKCAVCGGKPDGYVVSPWTLPADHPDSRE